MSETGKAYTKNVTVDANIGRKISSGWNYIPDTIWLFHVGMDPLDMEAALTNPSGKTELCEIRDLPEHLYDIKFTPEASGIHTVSLKHKGLHISGEDTFYSTS